MNNIPIPFSSEGDCMIRSNIRNKSPANYQKWYNVRISCWNGRQGKLQLCAARLLQYLTEKGGAVSINSLLHLFVGEGAAWAKPTRKVWKVEPFRGRFWNIEKLNNGKREVYPIVTISRNITVYCPNLESFGVRWLSPIVLCPGWLTENLMCF